MPSPHESVGRKQLEQNAKFIDRERSSVDFGPKDLDKVVRSSFLSM